MVIRTLIFTLFCLLMFAEASPVRPETVRISKWDRGGIIYHNLGKYWRYKRLGIKVVVDTGCMSACTFVTILGDNACATDKAILGFHQFSVRWQGVIRPMNSKSAADYFAKYPQHVRDAITARGGLTSKMMLFKGTELLRKCKA